MQSNLENKGSAYHLLEHGSEKRSNGKLVEEQSPQTSEEEQIAKKSDIDGNNARQDDVKAETGEIDSREEEQDIGDSEFGKEHADTGCKDTSHFPDMNTHENEINKDDSNAKQTPQIRQFTWATSGLTMVVPVHVGGTKVSAVVDTAAQVTLLNENLWEQMDININEPPERVQLSNAEEGSIMEGLLYSHVGFQLGGQKYFSEVVVAKIADDMILGLGFLKAETRSINFHDDSLDMNNGDKIYATMRGGNKRYNVSRVILTKKTKIPPNSVKFVNAKFQNPTDVTYALEPVSRQFIFCPQALVQGQREFKYGVVNMSPKHITLKKNEVMARGTEIDTMMLEREDKQADEVPFDMYVRDEEETEGGRRVCRVTGMKWGVPEVMLVSEDEEPLLRQPNHSSNSGLERTTEFAKQDDFPLKMQNRGGKTLHTDSLEQVTTTKYACRQLELQDPQLAKLRDEQNNETPVAQDENVGSSLGPPGVTKCATEDTNTETKALPEHLRTLYEDTAKRLTPEQAKQAHELLFKYQDVFAENDLDIGTFTALVHPIKTGTAFPIKQRMRRSPLGFEKEERKTIDGMLNAGVIEPSKSEWASPPVLVRKKDGSWRYCIDFRALNNVTVKDAYPLPLIEECMDSLADKKYFCTLDMNSGYWQIPVSPEDKEKTAFITRYGLYQFSRMPFGLSNSPATFQRAMHLVLSGLIWEIVIVYLDDINITGSTFEETLRNLEIVLQRFRRYGLKLKPRKCGLFLTEAKFLGRMADQNGIRITKEHVQDIQGWPVPKNKKEVQQFLGFINYHRGFIQGLAGMCAPLYELTKLKGTWDWTDRHTEAFNKLKEAMTNPPVLGYPNAKDTFILDTDASDFSIGAALSQLQKGKEQPISFASKALNAKQQQYCTTRKELLSVVVFAQHYEHYLLGRSFTIRTDHASLTWLMRFKKIGGQLARWLEYLSRFSYSIQHRSGVKHSNADGMSRIPQEGRCDYYESGRDLKSLPCEGCKYCTRMAEAWERYEELVDDVLPLSVHLDRAEASTKDDCGETSTVIRSQGVTGISSEPGIELSQKGDLLDPQLPKEAISIDPTVRVVTLGASDTGQDSNYMQQFDSKEMRELQLKDTDLKPLIQWLEQTEVPGIDEVLLQSSATRHLWLCRSQLKVQEGVLYYAWEEENSQRWLLVVPACLKEDVLQQCHDSKFGGHLGRDKTLAAVKQRFLWHGMSTDVQIHIRTCRECHVSKHVNRKPKAPLQNYQAGCPGDRVHLDILGPFAESASGYRYILMIIDQFSRWLEMVPLKVQDSETVARAFFESYVVRFGAPFVMHTDQGRNFDSAMMHSFCKLLEIVKTRTTPYRPSSNGQVERYNVMVLNFLRCFLRGKQKDWDQYLPVLGMNLRAMVNSSTGFTPNMLQLGHEVNMPVDVMFGMPRGSKFCDTASEYLKALLQRFHQVHAEARANLRGAQCRQKRRYDVNSKVRAFDVGDLVYRRNTVVKLGQSRKLNPVFTGPYLITRVLSPYLYQVKDQKKTLVLHHDKLKICEDRAIPFWVRRKRRQLWGSQDASAESEEIVFRGSQDAPEASEEIVENTQVDAVTGPDVQPGPGNSDLEETLPYAAQELFDGNTDLDETLPYSTTDLDETLPYSTEGNISEEEERHPWMREEEWGLRDLFGKDLHVTRSGRTIRPPTYLREYVGIH